MIKYLRYFVAILTVSLFMSTIANAETIFEYRPQYKHIFGFKDGYGVVFTENDHKHKLIDLDNNEYLIRDGMLVTSEGYVVGSDEEDFFICKMDDGTITEILSLKNTSYYIPINVNQNYVVVQGANFEKNCSAMGVLDMSGNITIPFEYEVIQMNGNIALCFNSNKCDIINLDTKIKTATISYEQFEDISFTGLGTLKVEEIKEGISQTKLLDYNGNTLVNSLLDVHVNGNYYILENFDSQFTVTDDELNEIITLYGSYKDMNDESIVYSDESLFNVVDLEGNLLFTKSLWSYKSVGKLVDGIAVVQNDDGTCYYVNVTGEMTSPRYYGIAYDFSNGYAIVGSYYLSNDKDYKVKYEVIDTNFNVVYTLFDVGLCADVTTLKPSFSKGYIITYDESENLYGFIKLSNSSDELKKYNFILANDDKNTSNLQVQHFSGITLPESAITRDGYTFSHWTDGTANYNPGDTFIMPDHDVTMTAVWVKDESNFTVSLDSQHARQGDTVTLTVSIQDNPGMISGGLTMKYDPDKFTFQSANGEEILKNTDIHTETVSTDNISVEWNSSGQICEGDGDILTLKFKVNEDVPDGAYKFTVCSPVLYTSENKKLHANDASGNLIVHDGIIGDVNKDKKTDDSDLILLKQYFAGWVNAAESIIDKFAADINMDGQLTRSDLMILARCLALWEGYHFGIPIIIQ